MLSPIQLSGIVQSSASAERSLVLIVPVIWSRVLERPWRRLARPVRIRGVVRARTTSRLHAQCPVDGFVTDVHGDDICLRSLEVRADLLGRPQVCGKRLELAPQAACRASFGRRGRRYCRTARSSARQSRFRRWPPLPNSSRLTVDGAGPSEPPRLLPRTSEHEDEGKEALIAGHPRQGVHARPGARGFGANHP